MRIGTDRSFTLGLLSVVVLALAFISAFQPVEAATGSSSVSRPTALDPLFGLYRETFTDMEVKVVGGHIRVDRTWDGRRWYVNRRWSPITASKESTGGSLASGGGGGSGGGAVGGYTLDQDYNADSYITIRRNAAVFKWVDGSTWVDVNNSNYAITRTDTGYRWSDRNGNWIEYVYDEENQITGRSRIASYGDRNGVTATFQHDEEGRLVGVFDRLGKQVLWYGYDEDGNISEIRDYTGRKVQYEYSNRLLSSVIDVRGQVWHYTYGSQDDPYSGSYLRTKTDPLGRSTTINTTASGVVKSILDHEGIGRSFKYEYDKTEKEFYKQEKSASDKVTETWYDSEGDVSRQDVNGVTVYTMRRDSDRKRTETDARGNRTVKEYDGWRNLTKVVHADGSLRTAAYDSLYSNVLEEVDENGVRNTYEYDTVGTLIRKTEAADGAEPRITTYTRNAYGYMLTRTVAGGAGDKVTVSATYDEYGNVTSRTDGEGNTTTFTHDAMGNVLTRTDPLGRIWKHTYDAAGNRLTETDPLNRTTRHEYDAVGDRIKTIDPAGRETAYGYDADGNLISITDPLNQTQRREYDVDGRLVTIVDESGRATQLSYDLAGRLVTVTDPAGNVTQMRYAGGADQPDAITYPTFRQLLGYDKRNRPVEQTDVLSADRSLTTHTAYDAVGNPTTATDPAGRVTTNAYDPLGRLIRTTDTAGQTTSYQYDHRDNLTAVTDANGGTHRFEYDKAGRTLREIRPLGATTTYEYDAAGRLAAQTDPGGRKQAYVYDAGDRLIEQRSYASAADSEPEKVVTFTYDSADNLTGFDDGTTSATYTYDERDRITAVSVDFGPFTKSYTYGYNAAGKKTSFTPPGGSAVTYSYDSGGRLAAMNLPGTGTLSVNAYRWQKPSQITLPGGSGRALEYDPLMRPTGIVAMDPAEQTVQEYNYQYDFIGNITVKATEHGTYRYDYDSADRLATVDNPTLEDEAYTYDHLGNRVSDSRASGEWAYNLDNQLTAIGDAESFAYDASGSLITHIEAGSTRSFGYNADNRLVRFEGDGSTATYAYDPLGRRVSKTVNGTTTYFLYSDEGLIGEYDGQGNAIREYGWWPDGLWGTDPVYLRTGGQVYFYHNDHLGTPQKLTGVSGAVVWEGRYQAFGKVETATAKVENPLRFPGQYFDAETGLHYNYFRDYDPSMGRYVESDPIGLDGGLNAFLYALGNPIGNIDALGLRCCTIVDAECVKRANERFFECMDRTRDQCTSTCSEGGFVPFGMCIVMCTIPLTHERFREQCNKIMQEDLVDCTKDVCG